MKNVSYFQNHNILIRALNSERIPEVDFLNLCVYVQTQDYTSSIFPKLFFFSNSEVFHFNKSQEVQIKYY